MWLLRRKRKKGPKPLLLFLYSDFPFPESFESVSELAIDLASKYPDLMFSIRYNPSLKFTCSKASAIALGTSASASITFRTAFSTFLGFSSLALTQQPCSSLLQLLPQPLKIRKKALINLEGFASYVCPYIDIGNIY